MSLATLAELGLGGGFFSALDNRYDCYRSYRQASPTWIGSPQLRVGSRYQKVFDPNTAKAVSILITETDWSSRYVGDNPTPLSFSTFVARIARTNEVRQGEVWHCPQRATGSKAPFRLVIRENTNLDLVERDLSACQNNLLYESNDKLRDRVEEECRIALEIRRELSDSDSELLSMSSTRNWILSSLHLLQLYGLEWHDAANLGAEVFGVPLGLSGGVIVDNRLYIVGRPGTSQILTAFRFAFERGIRLLHLAKADRALREKIRAESQ